MHRARLFCGRYRFGQEYFCRRRDKNFTTLARHRGVLAAIWLRLSNPDAMCAGTLLTAHSSRYGSICGRYRIRTCDLLNVNETLYQLS